MHAAARLPLAAALAAALLLAGCPEPKKCPAGEVRCGGVCFDLLTDRLSCGSCLNVCPSGATCAAGACECPAGQEPCGNRCVDVATDARDCGVCGHACGLGTCAAGACQCDASATSCGAAASPECVDTTRDAANCGTCGFACPKPGSSCSGSACLCLAPKPDECTTLCTDFQKDAANCGACGAVCPYTNDVCSGGVCACPPGLPTVCGQTCVDTASDEANCGGCGTRCATGANCLSGTCTCPGTEFACGDSGSQVCLDRTTNAANCGACAHACVAAQTCSGGSCTCPAGKEPCPKVNGNEALCCPGSGCQTVHANGLGQNYVDCSPLDDHSFAQAELAAKAWSTAGTTVTSVLQCGSCLCRETTTAAAVWCYAGSPMKGLVQTTASTSCLAAACPQLGGIRWH